MATLDELKAAFEALYVESTDCKPYNKTVGSTSTTVLEANPNRKKATFVNNDDEEIFLAEGDTAEMNKGIRLNPNGTGSYEINWMNLYKGKVTAICTSGSKSLCVQECE